MRGISLFPTNTHVDQRNRLVIGGCDTVALAGEFGTPLYVFDEATLRGRCAEYRDEFARRYADSLVVYACKAFVNRALAQLFREEGLGLDVASGGELAVGRSVGFPMERVYFNGNNKSREELEMAVRWGVGRVVVDNSHELSMLQEVAARARKVQDVLLRVSPGVDPHTHAYVATGVVDSKFGFPLAQAEEAVVRAMDSSALRLLGMHFHIGSQLFDLEPYRKAIGIVLDLAADMKARHGFALTELSTGGGLGISYSADTAPPTVADFAETMVSSLLSEAKARGIEPPRLVVEPGRSVVGQAGVALYSVGAIKEIPGVRTYVCVDGGMADNIRPALYGAEYDAVVASRVEGEEERVTIAGKFCESGDILIRDIELGRVEPGDVIAVPCCGAYCLSMASNYNAALSPAIVMVKEGKARLIRRRQSYDDLTRRDIL